MSDHPQQVAIYKIKKPSQVKFGNDLQRAIKPMNNAKLVSVVRTAAEKMLATATTDAEIKEIYGTFGVKYPDDKMRANWEEQEVTRDLEKNLNAHSATRCEAITMKSDVALKNIEVLERNLLGGLCFGSSIYSRFEELLHEMSQYATQLGNATLARHDEILEELKGHAVEVVSQLEASFQDGEMHKTLELIGNISKQKCLSEAEIKSKALSIFKAHSAAVMEEFSSEASSFGVTMKEKLNSFKDEMAGDAQGLEKLDDRVKALVDTLEELQQHLDGVKQSREAVTKSKDELLSELCVPLGSVNLS